jgi:hypothetical protein
MNHAPKTLILSDGGLASLVACAVAKEAAAIDGRVHAGISVVPAMNLWGVAGVTQGLRDRAIRAQAEIFGFELWEPLSAPPQALPGILELREQETHGLIAVTQLAARKGCDVVVWPLQCAGPSASRDDDGLDLDWIARAADKAVLASRLVAVDSDAHHKPGLRIEVPYLDVTDHQLADLAAEMELPMRACWWWTASRRDGEQAVAERERWLRALAFVGWNAPAA